MPRAYSIRARLLIGLIGSLTLVLAAGGGGLYWLQRELLLQDFDRRLDRGVLGGMRAVWRRPPENAPPDPTNITQPQEAAPNLPEPLLFVSIWTEGQPKPDAVVPGDFEVDSRFIEMLTESQNSTHLSVVLPDGRDARVVVRKLWPWPGARGDWRRDRNRDEPNTTSPPEPAQTQEPPARPNRYVIAGGDLSTLNAALRDWLLLLLAGGAGAEVLVVTIVLLAVGRGLRPLRAMESNLAQMDDDDLGERLGVEQLPAELRPFVVQLNKLLERIEGAFNREREFTANAAHEFLTPLTAIRTQIEVALRKERSAEEYRATVERSLETLMSLQRLVSLLMDLARLEGGQVHARGERVDLVGVLREKYDHATVVAETHGCSIDLQLPGELHWHTDARLFDRIAHNLIDNAAHYADPGSTVHVVLQCVSDTVRLSVTNLASSLDDHDLPRLGDRFWRKDASRTDTAGHCGLGLSIVRRCVDVLRGTWSAQLEQGRLTIKIDLPQLAEPTVPGSAEHTP